MKLNASRIFARVAIVTVLLHPTIASAQEGNMLTETAGIAATYSANGGYDSVDDSPAAQAQKQRVNNLVTQYNNCRASARQQSRNKATKQAIRAQCVRQYQPKFAKACVGRATTIAICTKFNRRGIID